MGEGIKKYLLLVCFPLMLILPMLNDHYQWLPDVENYENRAFAKKPVFDIKKLDPFPSQYDTFYNDNFSYRLGLIQIFNAWKLKVFRRSPVPDKVAISKDNWLFPMGSQFHCYMGIDSLSLQELRELENELEYRNNYLKQRNCKMYVLVAPSKASVYPEKLGQEYYPLSDKTWGEQLIHFLKDNTTVQTVNFLDSLQPYKQHGNLYYKLDNHWNGLGAFFAANEAIKHIRADFPSLKLLKLSDYEFRRKEVSKGNMQKMLGNLVDFSEVDIDLVPKSGYGWQWTDKVPYPPIPGFAYADDYERDAVHPDTTKPRILVIADSFGQPLFPFLAENFSRTVMIFDDWQYKLNEDILANEKPDIVLYIIYEPLIRNIFNHLSKPEAQKP